tara:strand:+ start:45639 stop:45893 length:255 start_codon:yes stop_codon:yes gene_type:complete
MLKSIAKSYVWNKDKCFFISTINRESSADIESPPRIYAETLVWEYEWDTKVRGNIVAQTESFKDSIKGHIMMSERLREFGKFDE